jgi:hypothetical protein
MMCAREAIKTFNPSMTSLFVASIAKTARQGNRRTAARSARLFFCLFLLDAALDLFALRRQSEGIQCWSR